MLFHPLNAELSFTEATKQFSVVVLSSEDFKVESQSGITPQSCTRSSFIDSNKEMYFNDS